MPTPRRPILSQLVVTTLTALTVVALDLYLTRPRQERFEQSLIQRHLDHTISVNFHDTPLDDALRSLSEQTGIPIKLDLPTLAPIPIMHNQKVTLTLNDVPARAALDVLLKQIANDAPILWTERDDHVLVSNPSVLTPVVRIYDVEDLLDEYVAFRTSLPNEQYTVVSHNTIGTFKSQRGLSDDPRAEAIDDLTVMVMALVDPDSWIQNGGRVGDMHYRMRRLVVAQTPENHLKIQRMLAAIRERGFAEVSNAAEPED
jgi:hypothetical protein